MGGLAVNIPENDVCLKGLSTLCFSLKAEYQRPLSYSKVTKLSWMDKQTDWATGTEKCPAESS